jgi:uncharacterized membrane protein YidH (DUF202 family)
VGASFGAFLGLLILLFSSQLYFDFQKILRGTLFKILLSVFAAVVVCLGMARWAILVWVNQNGFELHTFYDWVVCLLGLMVFGFILLIIARSIKKNIEGQC